MLAWLASARRCLVVVTSLVLWMSTAWAVSAPPLPAGIPPAERARLDRVAEAASVATRVQTEPFLTRRAIFEYLLDHPDFAAHVTRTLRLGRYRISRTADGMYLDDGWGGTGHFWVVHAVAGTRVTYCRGAYRQAMLPTINGEAVVMIEYDVTPVGGGRDLVTATVSGFVKLDSRILAALTKIASPAAQWKADLEARRLMRTFARVSRVIDDNPSDVYERLQQRPDIPRAELEEFGRLLNPR